MNLLPAGQLDGGHIMRALFGNNSKYISYFVVMVLIVLGFVFAGWWIFTFLILMLGTTHPPPLNDISRLSRGRKAIGVFSIVMLVICFIPIPIQVAEIPAFEVGAVDSEIMAGSGDAVNFTLILENTGDDGLTYEIEESVIFWKAGEKYFNTSDLNGTEDSMKTRFAGSGWKIQLQSNEISISKKRTVEFRIDVKTPDDSAPGDELEFIIEFEALENPYVENSITLRVVIGEISLHYDKISQELKPGTYYDFELEVANVGNRSILVGFNASINQSMSKNHRGWSEPVFNSTPRVIAPDDPEALQFTVRAPDSARKGDMIVISFRAYDTLDPEIFDQANFEVRVI
jgi:hypothetical protein